MSITVLAFGAMCLVAVAFIFVALASELEINLPSFPLTQTGDTSISRRSITWLAATALASALFVCFVLM